MRKKKNVHSWLGHVERMSIRTAKKIYEGKLSGKRGRGRPRLTFENTVKLKILHVKSMRTFWRACMKRLMTEDEAKEVCKDRSVRRSILLDYSARDTSRSYALPSPWCQGLPSEPTYSSSHASLFASPLAIMWRSSCGGTW